MEIPADYFGLIDIPWVLWDVQGVGQVRIVGRDFSAGSSEIREFLARPGHSVTTIEVVSNISGLALIMMVNPLWYDMRENNELNLTGKDVWAIEVGTYPLVPANRPPSPVLISMMK